MLSRITSREIMLPCQVHKASACFCTERIYHQCTRASGRILDLSSPLPSLPLHQIVPGTKNRTWFVLRLSITHCLWLLKITRNAYTLVAPHFSCVCAWRETMFRHGLSPCKLHRHVHGVLRNWYSRIFATWREMRNVSSYYQFLRANFTRFLLSLTRNYNRTSCSGADPPLWVRRACPLP